MMRGAREYARSLARRIVEIRSHPEVKRDTARNPFGTHVCVDGDPLYGTAPSDLEKLTAQLLLYADTEKVRSLKFDYCANTVFAVFDGDEYELAPLPAPVMVDMLRRLVNSTGVQPGHSSTIELPLRNAVKPLRIEHHRPSGERPRITITGFQERKGLRQGEA